MRIIETPESRVNSIFAARLAWGLRLDATSCRLVQSGNAMCAASDIVKKL